jgi:uncharacterized GH25 family protein
MRSKFGAAVAAIVLLLVAAAAIAHETWLVPGRFAVAAGAELRFDLSSGMEFPELDHAIKPERVESSGCRLAMKTTSPLAAAPADKSLRFTVRLVGTGTATVWVTLKPRMIELTEKQVTEYFDEIGASAAVRKAWSEGGPGRRWRELYTKHAKTIVRVGALADDRSWREPVGQRLEIVPESDPTALRAGDKLLVRVLKDGKPIAGFAVNPIHDRKHIDGPRLTGEDGRVSVELTSSGRWLLSGTDLRRSSRENVDWESDFATLTLEVHQK